MQTRSQSKSVTTDAPKQPSGTPWRGDIQGLRAIAVLAVVVYHLWPTALRGGYIGVDVFFVISGFLITGHLMRTEQIGRRAPIDFWVRRIRRLLPASLLVIAASLLATVLVAPMSEWANAARAASAAALYYENWHLAASAVNYLQASRPPTAFQHFWSLSVEEQFYLVWPLILFGVALMARRVRRSRVVPTATVLAAIVLGSFLYSIHRTAVAPTTAYFSTPVRAWEFALGGLIAMVLSSAWFRRTPTWLLALAGWTGIVAIVASAIGFDDATPFPGWLAVVPVAGAALVLAAGSRPLSHSNGPDGVLRMRPMMFVGDISYAWYLWHWPLIVLVPYATGAALSGAGRAAIFASSLALAIVTKYAVEERFRHPRPRTTGRVFVAAALAMLVVVLGSVTMVHEVNQRRQVAALGVAVARNERGTCFGAGAMPRRPGACPHVGSSQIVPRPVAAAEDRTTAYADNCFAYPPYPELTTCEYGDANARYSIAVVGNSHAGHWLTALQALMHDEDFRITTYLASTCNVSVTPIVFPNPADSGHCVDWATRVADTVASGNFDLVVTSAIQARPPVARGTADEEFARLTEGHRAVVQNWVDHNVDVLIIRDTPRSRGFGPIPDCVAIARDPETDCSGPRKQWLLPDPVVAAARAVNSDRVTVADLTDHFCDATTCFGVIGGVTAFYDDDHMTKTFSETLAPFLRPSVHAALN